MNQIDLIDTYKIFTQTQKNTPSSQYIMDPSPKLSI